jgi:hypothetical protein
MAQPELAAAGVVEQIVRCFDIEGAPLLVVARTSGADEREPQALPSRLEPRHCVAQKLVQRNATSLAGRQPMAGADENDAVATGSAARQIRNELEPQGQPAPPDLASEHIVEAAG